MKRALFLVPALIVGLFVGAVQAADEPIRLQTPKDIISYLEGSWFFESKQAFPGRGEVTLQNVMTYYPDYRYVHTITDPESGLTKTESGIYQVKPIRGQQFGLAHQLPGRPARPAMMEAIDKDKVRNGWLKLIAERMKN